MIWMDRCRTVCGTAHEASSGNSPSTDSRTRRTSSRIARICSKILSLRISIPFESAFAASAFSPRVAPRHGLFVANSAARTNSTIAAQPVLLFPSRRIFILGVLVLHHSSNCFLVRLRRADHDQTHRRPGRLRVPRLRIFLVACQAFAPRGEGNGLGFEKLPVEFSRKLQASRWVCRCDGSEVSVAKIRI